MKKILLLACCINLSGCSSTQVKKAELIGVIDTGFVSDKSKIILNMLDDGTIRWSVEDKNK